MRRIMLRWGGIGLVVSFLPSAWAAQPAQAERANARALVLLSEGDAGGAEAAAREALSASARFHPEEEMADAPEKGLLFEDMILEARAAYRARRARYFLTLGRALTRQERWLEARKALRRSAALTSSADPHLVLSTHGDLSVRERIDALLTAYFCADADPSRIERSLMETGAFGDRISLLALIDRRRYLRDVVADFPEMEIRVEPLPEIRTATDRGVFVSSDHLREGAVLVLYLPAAGCGRCSEELDGIHRALSEARREGKQTLLVTFVEERDLAAARRIARLLALTMEVGRLERFPAEIVNDSQGQVWIVSREGLLQARIPLGDELRSRDIHRRVAAVLAPIEAAEEKERTGSDPTVREIARAEARGRSLEALGDAIELAVRREAGPTSLTRLYALIERSIRSVLGVGGQVPEVFKVLDHLSRLRGAGEAKAAALAALDENLGRKLFETAERIEPQIDREAAFGQGEFRISVSRPEDSSGKRQILLQRSFVAGDSLLDFDFVSSFSNGRIEVVWAALESKTPSGVGALEDGAAFFFTDENECEGLRWVREGKVLFEGCPARIVEGRIVEEHGVLVDSPPAGADPMFFRRGRVEGGKWVPAETALDRGLRSFRQAEYAAALSAFEEAAKQVDPLAPYDEVDLRYNRARCLEAQGKIREALALFETIGDVAYQDLVDERIHILSSGGR